MTLKNESFPRTYSGVSGFYFPRYLKRNLILNLTLSMAALTQTYCLSNKQSMHEYHLNRPQCSVSYLRVDCLNWKEPFTI